MVVDPEAIRRFLQPFIDSNIFLMHHFLSLEDYMSVDFMSQEHGVPHEGPKDSNEGD
jgi:hypothetical protein